MSIRSGISKMLSLQKQGNLRIGCLAGIYYWASVYLALFHVVGCQVGETCSPLGQPQMGLA